MFEAWRGVVDASILMGESARAVVGIGFEEVVDGRLSVSGEEEVVEQPVQREGEASQVSGLEPPNQNLLGQE